MGEIIQVGNNEISTEQATNELLDESFDLLNKVNSMLVHEHSMSVPIAELSTLGAGVASLIPALNTVTQTTTLATDGLYTLANMAVGDTLKMAKNGNFWGAFKTAEGASKFAQLQPAGPITATTKAAQSLNPATMMMAVALFSIEQELGKIEEMQKQILSFLEMEKEAEVEADVTTLMSIVRKYKMNWDNERFVASNHKLTVDIQRTARGNMNSYAKMISEAIGKKQLVIAQSNVKQSFTNLEKKFNYYRLSLYNFALASFMDIMLSGNFKEAYILDIVNELEEMTDQYRELFEKSSIYLEKIGKSTIEANALKGVGTAGKAIGKFIGKIPLIKEGQVDEYLQDSGSNLKENAYKMEQSAVHGFASLNNPGIQTLINKMEDMIQIYNHTDRICFDNNKIYLIANAG